MSRLPVVVLALSGAWGCAAGPGGPAAAPAPAPTLTASRANEAAVYFMSGMIHHHAQAIQMADWAVTHDASPFIGTLAQRIHISQRDEIELMRTWLRDVGEPVPEPSVRGMRMVMNGTEHDMLMPGMLSEEQMGELDAARGAAFDRLFVTFMIQHHQGALAMVETLFESYGGTQDERIYKFASDVFADQTSEIDRMTQVLAGMTGTGNP